MISNKGVEVYKRQHVLIGALMLTFGVTLYLVPSFAFSGDLYRFSSQFAELYAITFVLGGYSMIIHRTTRLDVAFGFLIPMYVHLAGNIIRIIYQMLFAGDTSLLPLIPLYGLSLALLSIYLLGNYERGGTDADNQRDS